MRRIDDWLRSSKDWQFILTGVLVFVMMPLAGSWLADGAAQWFVSAAPEEERAWRWGVLFLAGLLVVVVGVVWLRIYGERFILPDIEPVKDVEPRRVLIAFLSDLNKMSIRRADDGRWCFYGANGGTNEIGSVSALFEFVSHKSPLTSWQQLARAMYHHHKAGVLQKVILLASKKSRDAFEASDGGESSAPHPEIFFDALLNDGALPERRVSIEVAPGNVDFEDLTSSLMALQQAIKNSGAEHRDIVIDVTGGQKTASIAGALVTLDKRDLIFQYVPTGGPDEVKKGPDGVVVPKGYQVISRASSLSG